MQDLVQITEKDFDVILDLRYATERNVAGYPVYKNSLCYLHKDAITSLKKAINSAKKLGYKFKIWDCFRPFEAQQEFFDWNQKNFPNAIIFSNPKNGLVTHCRGIAIDLTLVDNNGNELNMGTDFDDLTKKAYFVYDGISDEIKANRLILKKIMEDVGFLSIKNEWWHFNLPNPKLYPII